MAMTIRWLGHSCFRVECGGYSVVIDPFEPGSVPGYQPISETADMVLCSHEHHDHGFREAVKLTGEAKEAPFTVTALPSFHDGSQGAQRGPNLIHLLEGGGVRVAHFGDVGCMPAPEVLAQLKGLDAALIPVGGFYTVGPQEAKAIADAVDARVVVPMHYRSGGLGYDVLGTLEDYLELCGRWVRYDTDTLEIVPDMPRCTAVLQYLGSKGARP